MALSRLPVGTGISTQQDSKHTPHAYATGAGQEKWQVVGGVYWDSVLRDLAT